jgi:hypothetical protein
MGFAALVAASVALVAPAAKAGPVQIVSSERYVQARIDRDGTETQGGRTTAPTSGPFKDTVSGDITGDGFFSHANGSIDTNLNESGLTFHATLSTQTQDTRSADVRQFDGLTTTDATFAEVVFSIDKPFDFTYLDKRVFTGTGNEPGREIGSDLTGDNGFSKFLGDGTSGTISPGTYTLRSFQTYQSFADSVLTDFDFTQDVAFRLSPVGGAGGGGPHSVPLPPAVWSGGIVLAACGAFYGLRRRLAV